MSWKDEAMESIQEAKTRTELTKIYNDLDSVLALLRKRNNEICWVCEGEQEFAEQGYKFICGCVK